jgi:hypothetical protein
MFNKMSNICVFKVRRAVQLDVGRMTHEINGICFTRFCPPKKHFARKPISIIQNQLQDEEMLKIALCESFAKLRQILCHESSSAWQTSHTNKFLKPLFFFFFLGGGVEKPQCQFVDTFIKASLLRCAHLRMKEL